MNTWHLAPKHQEQFLSVLEGRSPEGYSVPWRKAHQGGGWGTGSWKPLGYHGSEFKELEEKLNNQIKEMIYKEEIWENMLRGKCFRQYWDLFTTGQSSFRCDCSGQPVLQGACTCAHSCLGHSRQRTALPAPSLSFFPSLPKCYHQRERLFLVF